MAVDVLVGTKPIATPIKGMYIIGVNQSGASALVKLFPVEQVPQEVVLGSGQLSRLVSELLKELGASVVSFGADPTGASDDTAAFAAAIASGASKIRVPAGTYNVSKIVIDTKIARFSGEGFNHSLINVTTTTDHGMRIIGDATLGSGNVIELDGFRLTYTGAGQPVASGTNNNFAGIYCQRKVLGERVYVTGFTNDGLFYAPSDASEGTTSVLGTIGKAVFFSRWIDCWFKDNGRDGCRIRMGANACGFINCQFDRNGQRTGSGVGFHHLTDGGATYGNWVQGGQCSYNCGYGYHLESGTQVRMTMVYSEYNGSTDGTNTNGYTNTLIDVYVGDNLTGSDIDVGTVFNASSTHLRAPARGLNDSVIVRWGGRRVFGSTAYMDVYETTALATAACVTIADVNTFLNGALKTVLQNAGLIP